MQIDRHSTRLSEVQTIGVFRLQLFKRSEPFITDQAEKIARFSVLYIGRNRFNPGPDGATSLALSDFSALHGVRARIWQLMTRDATPYIKLLDVQRPALLHAHFGPDAVFALPLAKRLDIPLITTFHGHDVTMEDRALLLSRKPTWWNYLLHRRALAEHGAMFLCVSNYIRSRVISLGFPEERIRTHYIGVDTTTICPRGRQSPMPTILHVARLVEKKGTADLIMAFARVIREIPECELRIVGEGPLEATLRIQAEDMGLKSAVRFLGARPHSETLDLIAQAWVFALPSVTARSGDAEGLGMVLLEAAASGVPAVATRHGGIPEAVADGESGCLCAEHDIDAMADSLIELLRNDALRHKMGFAARERAVRHFDLTHQCVTLERIYADALGSCR